MWHIIAKADICPNAVETEITSVILQKTLQLSLNTEIMKFAMQLLNFQNSIHFIQHV